MSVSDSPDDTGTATEDSIEPTEISEPVVSRRELMRAAGAAGITAAGVATTSGTALGQSEETINYGSDIAHDPYINGVVVVDENKPDFSQLEYTADDGSVTSLKDSGVVMASRTDESTPHNPVTLKASDIVGAEYSAFPRGVQYDESGDGSADTDVEWHDPVHWTTSGATNGSISLTEVEDDGMQVSSSSLADGETVSANLDLSTVGANDATITDGMSRRFLQAVADIDALPSVVTITFAVIDSSGTEVTARYEPGGDTSTVAVLEDSTGDSKVSQVRLGELESAQSVTLGDIEQLEIRISASGGAGDGDITLHGYNVEKSEKWDYGTQEYTNSDSEIDTQTVYDPSGKYSITGIDTLPSYFSGATIKNLELDVELRMSHLPEDQRWVRVMDAPDAYDKPTELEQVAEFEWPSAYALSVTSEEIEDEVELPSNQYLEASYATGIADIEEWADIEDTISWTDQSGSYGSVGNTVTLKSSTSSSDRSAVRLRMVLSADQEDAVLSSGSSGTGAAAVGSGSGGFDAITSIVMGVVGALAVWKRNVLMGLFGGN